MKIFPGKFISGSQRANPGAAYDWDDEQSLIGEKDFEKICKSDISVLYK